MTKTASAPILLCAGHVTLDRYGREKLPGGCVTYAALAFSALGGKARVATCAADDFPRRFFPENIEVILRPSRYTTVFSNSYLPDGRRVQQVDQIACKVPADCLPLEWRGPHILFLAPVIGEIDPAAWMEKAGAETVALGVQGFVRKLEGRRVVCKRFDAEAAWLRRVDLAFLSDDDCRDDPDLVERLCRTVSVVVLTKQRRGCSVFSGGEEFRVGTHPAREADPTGAGDTFAAGFMYAYACGASLIEAARLGAACASIIIEDRAACAADRIRTEARLRAALVSGPS